MGCLKTSVELNLGLNCGKFYSCASPYMNSWSTLVNWIKGFVISNQTFWQTISNSLPTSKMTSID
jgi:hypothetical protein